VDSRFIPYQIKGGNPLVGLKSSFRAFDDDAAAVVATHDIDCNSHKNGLRPEGRNSARPPTQAPAVTVMIWRPL
jgi:hypothetical protein